MHGIAVVTPVPLGVWTEVLNADPQALPFQTPAWMDGICAGGRYSDESRLYVTPTARIIVLLAGKRFLPGIGTVAALPHGMGAGGILSDKPMTAEDLRAVMLDLSRLPYVSLLIRPNPLHADAFGAVQFAGWHMIQRTTHILDLSGGFEKVWTGRIQSEKRNKIRKSIKAGVALQCGNDEHLLRTYYDLYMKWCDARSKRHNIPKFAARWLYRRREPFWKFANAAKAMGDGFRIYVAYLDDRPLAAGILLISGASAVYWRGVSDFEASTPVAANDFLQKHMIQQACDAGCMTYHMGESGGVPSLMKYKESYGAKAYDCAEYYHERLPIRAVRKALDYGYRRLGSLLLSRKHTSY